MLKRLRPEAARMYANSDGLAICPDNQSSESFNSPNRSAITAGGNQSKAAGPRADVQFRLVQVAGDVMTPILSRALFYAEFVSRKSRSASAGSPHCARASGISARFLAQV